MGYEQTLEKVILRLDREEKEKDRRIAVLEEGYEELKIAALNAIQAISGGQEKADLRDAYDKATEQLEALKETK